MLLAHQAFVAFPSSLPRLVSFDDYLEAIYQRQNFTEEEDFESIKEALQEAYAMPLDLNKVTPSALEELGILSKNQIKNYFNHLATTGSLYSRYELQAIPDFDLTTIALLLPFVYAAETYHLSYDGLKMNPSKPNYFLFRYTPAGCSSGVNHHSTLGSLDQCMLQLSCNHQNDITWGITARKQAGESFCWDHATYRYGFNLWSIFVMVTQNKYINRMIVGDYQIGQGQGLLLSAGYSRYGIGWVIRSNNRGIRPYKGIRRIGLRGVAITSDIANMELTGFYASNHLDATLERNGQHKLYTKRIDYTGKYDTTHNLAKKGTIHEQVLGCTIRKQYDRNQTEVGINLLYNHYDIPIALKDGATNPYLLQRHLAASVFYRLLWKNWIWFGEAGLTIPNITESKKAKALIVGCMISLSRYVDLSGTVYYYGQGLYTPYGNAFKHYTTDHANEKGGHLCLQLTPLPTWTITTSSHFFSKLSPKSDLDIPNSGHRFTTRSHYAFSRATLLLVQYKLHHKLGNVPKAATRQVEREIQHGLKCKIDHKLTHVWWTHWEVQYTRYTLLEEIHHGYGLAITQKWKKNKWQFSCKAILFNTQNYLTRLYFYLPSPLYSGTQFRPYYGNGMTTIWLVCWKPISWVRLEIKYAFIYANICKTKPASRCPKGKVSHHGIIQLLISF